ncbi:MAG: ABC transporter permease subunit [Lachnospiraceae bacterium]|nr:ABC transporter permease subunit [Lachnospiraceae bacterium]
MSIKTAYKIRFVFTMIFLAVVTILVFYPFLYILSAAVAKGNTMTGLSCIPFGNGFGFTNFQALFTKTNFPVWFGNTFIISIVTMLGTLAICTVSAYIFSRFQFWGKRSMLTVMFVLQIIPSFLAMIAMYYVLYWMGGLNKIWGLILVYIAGNIPYNVWLVKTYLDAIPKNMDEAAIMDGASRFCIFTNIILPAIRPIVIFLAITSFTAPWLDFIFPKLILRSQSKYTVALGLYNLYNEQGDFGTFCAGAVLIVIPFVLFFLATQNMLVESMSTTLDEDL